MLQTFRLQPGQIWQKLRELDQPSKPKDRISTNKENAPNRQHMIQRLKNCEDTSLWENPPILYHSPIQGIYKVYNTRTIYTKHSALQFHSIPMPYSALTS